MCPCPSLNVGLSSQAPLEPGEAMGQVVFHLFVQSFEEGLDCGGN